MLFIFSVLFVRLFVVEDDEKRKHTDILATICELIDLV